MSTTRDMTLFIVADIFNFILFNIKFKVNCLFLIKINNGKF